MWFGTSRSNDHSEDYFAQSRMSFGDHIDELRTHLIRAIQGFLVAMALSFFIGQPLLKFIAAPVEQQLAHFYNQRVKNIRERMASDASLKGLDKPTEFLPVTVVERQAIAEATADEQPPPIDAPGRALWIRYDRPLLQATVLAEVERTVGKQPVLATLRVEEAFMVYFKLCMVSGFVLASPWIFWQAWAFVAAGLYPHEKRYVHVYLPLSLGLFFVGGAICQFFVIPKAIEALLWFNEWLGLEPDLRLNDWLGFALMMPLIFGLSFQTPLVMLFLERVGILTIDLYRNSRRIAWFALAVFAAVVTPSIDAFSMLLLWVPLCLLFELGIILCRMSRSRSEFELDESESESMVEV